jgi:hypothetical protein
MFLHSFKYNLDQYFDYCFLIYPSVSIVNSVFIKNYLFVLNLCEKLSHKCDVDTYNTMTISKINFFIWNQR